MINIFLDFYFLRAGNWTFFQLLSALALLGILLLLHNYRKKFKKIQFEKSNDNTQQEIIQKDKVDEDQNESFEIKVEKMIISKSEFKISQVSNLEYMASMEFKKEVYPAVTSLIKSKNWTALLEMNIYYDAVDEFLEIYTFNNQDKVKFAVTLYDSLELVKHPLILDIFQLD